MRAPLTGRQQAFRKCTTRRGLLLLLATLLSLALQAAELQPYELHYQTRAQGMTVKTVRTLERNASLYQLSQVTSAMLMQTNEVSQFYVNAQGTFTPRSFIYQRKILGNNKFRQTFFYPAKKRAVYSENSDMPTHIAIPADVHDVYSFQEKLRLELMQSQGKFTQRTYQVLDKDKVRPHVFRLTGTEWISTPQGYLDTIRIERVRDETDKKTTVWLARNWGYVIVKITHTEAGEPAYSLSLSHGTLNGKAISGRKDKPVTPSVTTAVTTPVTTPATGR